MGYSNRSALLGCLSAEEKRGGGEKERNVWGRVALCVLLVRRGVGETEGTGEEAGGIESN